MTAEESLDAVNTANKEVKKATKALKKAETPEA